MYHLIKPNFITTNFSNDNNQRDECKINTDLAHESSYQYFFL